MRMAGCGQIAARNTLQQVKGIPLLLWSSSIYQSVEGSQKLAFFPPPLRKIPQERAELLLRLPSARQYLKLKLNDIVTNLCSQNNKRAPIRPTSKLA